MKQARFKNKETGATFVEYAILLALIALLSIGGIRALGITISGAFDDVNSEFQSELSS